MRHFICAVVVVVSLALLVGCGQTGQTPSPATQATPTREDAVVATSTVAGTRPASTPTVTSSISPTATSMTTKTSTPKATPASGPSVLLGFSGSLWRWQVGSGKLSEVFSNAADIAVSSVGTLAFRRGSGSGADLWAANPDGGSLRRMTNTSGEEIWPTWSPDGSTLAFTFAPSPLNAKIPYYWHMAGGPDAKTIASWSATAEVWLVNADGQQARKLARGYAPSWSPEGKRVAFFRTESDVRSVMLVNDQGKNEWRVFTPPPAEGEVGGGQLFGQLAWTANGQDLIHDTSAYAMLSDWGLLKRSATLNWTATSVVAQVKGYVASSLTSSGGEYLACDFYGGDGRGPTDGLSVFRLNQASSGNFYGTPIDLGATRVLNVSSGHHPAWSADGKTLAYAIGNELWLWDVGATAGRKVLDTPAPIDEIAWDRTR